MVELVDVINKIVILIIKFKMNIMVEMIYKIRILIYKVIHKKLQV